MNSGVPKEALLPVPGRVLPPQQATWRGTARAEKPCKVGLRGDSSQDSGHRELPWAQGHRRAGEPAAGGPSMGCRQSSEPRSPPAKGMDRAAEGAGATVQPPGGAGVQPGVPFSSLSPAAEPSQPVGTRLDSSSQQEISLPHAVLCWTEPAGSPVLCLQHGVPGWTADLHLLF